VPTSQAEVDAVTEAVVLASRALVGLAARSLAAVNEDVSLPQYRALVVLRPEGGKTAGALADVLQVNPSTVTRLSDRLVRKGLVRRYRAPNSRREVRLRLTTAGRALVDQVLEHRRRAVREIVSSLPPASRSRLAEALTEFAAATGEVPYQPWAAGWFPAEPLLAAGRQGGQGGQGGEGAGGEAKTTAQGGTGAGTEGASGAAAPSA
jgi:DNA-binding MarR family transcriptional regulator